MDPPARSHSAQPIQLMHVSALKVKLEHCCLTTSSTPEPALADHVVLDNDPVATFVFGRQAVWERGIRRASLDVGVWAKRVCDGKVLPPVANQPAARES